VSESEGQECHSSIGGGVTSSNETSLLVEEEAPFQNA
jgi:hypothetical protein